MKKILVLGVLLFTSFVFSQRISEGESQVNAGFGFSGWGVPVYAGFDYGIDKDITIGGVISFASKTERYGGVYDVDGSWFSIGVNGNYHFNTILEIPEPWDVYAGLKIAYDSFSWDYPNGVDYRGDSSGIGLSAQIGGRYYFSDRLGVNLEFGFGNVTATGGIGITVKL